MSNTGDEERLSTPSEESVEDEDNLNQNQKERNGHASVLPVKVKAQAVPENHHHKYTKNMARSNSSDRDAIDDSKLPRRLVQISEENLVLKKQLKKQEERIKILATKLIRVISERSNKTKREEILLDEQKARIADLEHEVSILREKLHVTKQQLSSYTRLIPHHHHPPPSRQTSMLSSSSATSLSKPTKKGRPSRPTSGGGSQPPRPSTASSSRGNLLIDKNFADRVEELLLEAKAENQALEDQLKNCRQRLSSTEEVLEKLKESFKNKELEHQEEIMSIKSQFGKEEDIAKKKKQLSDNIQLIRLQRESRRTASWLSTLEAQNRALEANLSSTTENLQQLETQLSETQEELGQEQERNIMLQKQMEDATSALSRMKELEAQITSLQEENKIVKETNESLLKNAYSVKEKAEKAETIENHMKAQLSHLETALKAEMQSKSDIQESLRMEKEKSLKLESTNEKLQGLLDKLNEEKKQRVDICCGNDTTNNVHSITVDTSSTNFKVDSVSNGDDNKMCPNQKRVDELENELKNVRHLFEIEKKEHEKVLFSFKAQVAETEKYHRKVEEISHESKKADEFHCKKLHELVKGLEERKKQISYLEKCMEELKRQQSFTNVSCKVCESRNQMNSDVEETCAPNDNEPEVVIAESNLQPVDDNNEDSSANDVGSNNVGV